MMTTRPRVTSRSHHVTSVRPAQYRHSHRTCQTTRTTRLKPRQNVNGYGVRPTTHVNGGLSSSYFSITTTSSSSSSRSSSSSLPSSSSPLPLLLILVYHHYPVPPPTPHLQFTPFLFLSSCSAIIIFSFFLLCSHLLPFFHQVFVLLFFLTTSSFSSPVPFFLASPLLPHILLFRLTYSFCSSPFPPLPSSIVTNASRDDW